MGMIECNREVSEPFYKVRDYVKDPEATSPMKVFKKT